MSSYFNLIFCYIISTPDPCPDPDLYFSLDKDLDSGITSNFLKKIKIIFQLIVKFFIDWFVYIEFAPKIKEVIFSFIYFLLTHHHKSRYTNENIMQGTELA